MKKLLIIVLTCIIFLLMMTACSSNDNNPVNSEANVYNNSGGGRSEYLMSGESMPTITSIDSLAFMSEGIVRAVVLDSRTDWVLVDPPLPGEIIDEEELLNRSEINTFHRIRVLEVFKGNANVGDIIEVAQSGGRLGNDELINYDLQIFMYSDELVFFIHRIEARDSPRTTRLATPGQSVYRAIPSNARGTNDFSKGIAAAYDANPELENLVLECVGSWNELILTIGDLILIRYEAGLGPRPLYIELPVGIDRDRLNEGIARAEYLLPQNYMLPGWDAIPPLLEEAIRVRDNIFSRQIHVNVASSRLRNPIISLKRSVDLPLPTPPPPAPTNRDSLIQAITQAQSLNNHDYTTDSWEDLQHEIRAAMIVYENYFATQSQIDTATANLQAAINALEPISPYPYPTPPPEEGSPTITGPYTMYLEAGYSATNAPGFLVTGDPPPTVTLSDNQGGLITWHDVHSRLNIAAGIPVGVYTIVLTAYNGVGAADTHTFVLTVGTGESVAAFCLGDVNRSGYIDMDDHDFVWKYLTGLLVLGEDIFLSEGDFSESGTITAMDAMMIYFLAQGWFECWELGCTNCNLSGQDSGRFSITPEVRLQENGAGRADSFEAANSFEAINEIGITAYLPCGTCAMEFISINELWNNRGSTGFMDVNFDAPWERIYLTVTAYGQSIELVLVNPS